MIAPNDCYTACRIVIVLVPVIVKCGIRKQQHLDFKHTSRFCKAAFNLRVFIAKRKQSRVNAEFFNDTAPSEFFRQSAYAVELFRTIRDVLLSIAERQKKVQRIIILHFIMRQQFECIQIHVPLCRICSA